MTNAEKMAVLQTVFALIFNSKATGSDITQVKVVTNTGTWPGRWFKNAQTGQQSLRGFDFTCNLGDRIISLRCLEQNPDKTDNYGNLKKYANLARQGHQIMWIIDRNGSFIGRIQDGTWYASFTPATSPTVTVPPTQPNVQNTPTSQNQNMNDIGLDNLPEIANDVEFPDYILEEVASMEDVPESDWGYGE